MTRGFLLKIIILIIIFMSINRRPAFKPVSCLPSSPFTPFLPYMIHRTVPLPHRPINHHHAILQNLIGLRSLGRRLSFHPHLKSRDTRSVDQQRHHNPIRNQPALPPSCSFKYHSTHSSRCNSHTTEYCYSQQTFLGDLVINEASQTPGLQI